MIIVGAGKTIWPWTANFLYVKINIIFCFKAIFSEKIFFLLRKSFVYFENIIYNTVWFKWKNLFLWVFIIRYENFLHKNAHGPQVLLKPLKGQSNEIFDLQFFHNSNLSGALANGLKYFWFWFRFCGVIRSLGLKKLTPRGESKLNFILWLGCKNEKCISLIVEYDSTFIFVTLSL